MTFDRTKVIGLLETLWPAPARITNSPSLPDDWTLATLMKACLTLEVLVHAALALTTRQAVAMVLMVVFGAYAFVWGSVSQTVRMRATPDRFQGRVGSVYWLGIVLGLVVGELLGGVIAEHFGAAAPFWFAFVGSGLTLVAFWRQLDHVAHARPDAEGSANQA